MPMGDGKWYPVPVPYAMEGHDGPGRGYQSVMGAFIATYAMSATKDAKMLWTQRHQQRASDSEWQSNFKWRSHHFKWGVKKESQKKSIQK